VVVKFSLCDLNVHGCRGCDACRKDGVCIVQDDMQILYPHLRRADSIVLAAPTYFQGMPAVPKMVVDRCQPFWVLKYVLGQAIAEPGKPERLGALLSCSGTTSTHAFDGSRLIMRTLWNVLEVAPTGEVMCPGVDAKGDIREQPGARVAAKEIGRLLARETKRKGRMGG
jgi:multimeric flavodoxin WrbA